jgi:hypothetical protein
MKVTAPGHAVTPDYAAITLAAGLIGFRTRDA